MDSGKRYHDLVNAGRALNYGTRCRLVVDEVIARYATLVDLADRSAGAWAWLEAELGAAASTPGTVAAALRPASLVGAATADSAADLRAWAWGRLESPSAAAWSRGAESRVMWSFLMSPAPADEDELWWLASSNALTATQLRTLIGVAGATPAIELTPSETKRAQPLPGHGPADAAAQER